MEEKINIEDIMQEVRKAAAKRIYRTTAADFQGMPEYPEDSIHPFSFDDFYEQLQSLMSENTVDSDVPITGKGRLIKRVIKKANLFLLKPMWDKQNAINVEIVNSLDQIKDYIYQGSNTEERIEYLEKKCKEYEDRILELEKMVKEK